MRTYTTIARDRGVTTIPVDLRETAGVRPDSALTWVELANGLWLVGLSERHPEEVAPLVASALIAEHSPFPKLMRRLLSGEISLKSERGRRRTRQVESPPTLTEEQMIALGSASPTTRRGRGR